MNEINGIIEHIQSIILNDEIQLNSTLAKIAQELSVYFDTEIYFCEIKGKRWSYMAGSGDTVYGSNRIQLTEKWCIISDRERSQHNDNQLIFNMIRGIRSD